MAPFVAADGPVVWRLSVPPAASAEIVAAIRAQIEIEAFYDWGGGLVWLTAAAGNETAHEAVRAAIAPHGGHALLARATPDQRAQVPVFQPQPAGLSMVTARIKDAFDPRHILNPGRMYDGV